MPNNQLIDRLAGDLKPVRRRSPRIEGLLLMALCVLELALFLGMGQARPDMHMAIWSLDPATSPRRGLRLLIIVIALCFATGWLVDAARAGIPTLAARLAWHDGLQCVYKMVVLSVPPVIGLGLLMRRGAPTDTGGTALAVGIAAAAWGAFVFVFACPHDDPLYVAVWYTVGCGLVTLVARLLLPLLTRW
jgi:hypothetical protein